MIEKKAKIMDPMKLFQLKQISNLFKYGKHRFRILVFLFLFFPFQVYSQGPGENSIGNLVRIYQKKAESASVLSDCGHAFDGPSFWVKQMENRSLDAAVTLTEKDRQKIGKQINEEILRNNKISNLKRTDILNILQDLTDALEPTESRVFNLVILETPEVNAYTTLGGYIYLTSGLIKFVNTPDELAFILGHEIGHEVELHTQRKVAKVMVSSNFLKNVNLQDYTQVAMNISTRFSAPFDQIDEYGADKFGSLLAQKAGYDPERFGDFFIKIRNSRNSSIIDKLLSTHPFPEHRQKCIEEYFSEKQ